VKVTVDINITHPNRGDLVIHVISPPFEVRTTKSLRRSDLSRQAT